MNKEHGAGLESSEQVRLHHIGFVLASIEASVESFARSLGARWDGNITFDPLQKVCVTFLKGACDNDSLIELVEPRGEDSPVKRFLQRGGGLHHLCYEVSDLEGYLEFYRSVGNTIVQPPTPAVAFGGRRIAWAVARKRLLVELLEG